MIRHKVAQGTTAWLELRKGIPTASCFDKIITPSGSACKADTTEKYLNHLLAERILGRPIDGFKSSAMEHGNDYEDAAVASYELARGVETERIGFITTDDGLIGCSPDRFIIGEPRGSLECKSPANPAIHVGYLRASAGASTEYKVQLQGQIWTCELDWVEIISYHPSMPDAVFRVYRDDGYIAKMEVAVRAFSTKLELLSADFRARGWIKDTPAVPGDERLWLTQDDIDAAMSDIYGGAA